VKAGSAARAYLGQDGGEVASVLIGFLAPGGDP
jgi:hypothetical protein